MPVIRICSSGTYLLLSLGTMVSVGIEYSIRLFSADEALPVRLQAIGQLLRTGEGDEMAGGHLVGTSGHSRRGHGCLNGVPDWRGSPLAHASATTSGETSWKKASIRSSSAARFLPSRAACSARAFAWPVLVHHSPADSPGEGTIAFSITSRSTGTRSHTSGAVNPPSDWATRTIPVRSPIASTTAPAYSANPAESSLAGRSAATTSWPRPRSSGSSKCQYQASPPAPGINT